VAESPGIAFDDFTDFLGDHFRRRGAGGERRAKHRRDAFRLWIDGRWREGLNVSRHSRVDDPWFDDGDADAECLHLLRQDFAQRFEGERPVIRSKRESNDDAASLARMRAAVKAITLQTALACRSNGFSALV
jgi:hypothetical protein